MDVIRYSLLADGRSDERLFAILDWLFHQLLPEVVTESIWIGTPHRRRVTLAGRIANALDSYPSDVLFVHRDAENATRQDRLDEIANAHASAPNTSDQAIIPVIPIRMTEAWLLIDMTAIRKAAGNPNGGTELNLPRLRELENLRDPYSVLSDLINNASELRGRRLKRFNSDHACLLVANYITDFSPLRELSAFQALENDLKVLIERKGWGRQ